MSSQETQAGGADFVTEHHDLYTVTLVLRGGENWGALLHHPPLVSFFL